jgi:hypothetical protein
MRMRPVGICLALAMMGLISTAFAFVPQFHKGMGSGRKNHAQFLAMATMPERNVVTIKVKDNGVVREVVLVGTMHYNPVSLQRVGDAIDALSQENRLASVVIESCATRYEKWKDSSPGSVQRQFLESEMQVAADRAKAAGVELILGDQPIEDVGARTKVLLGDTFSDLARPLEGGWARCAVDVWRAATSAFPSPSPSASFSALGLRDIFDPPLVAAAPVSLIRYPLAWLVRYFVLACSNTVVYPTRRFFLRSHTLVAHGLIH